MTRRLPLTGFVEMCCATGNCDGPAGAYPLPGKQHMAEFVESTAVNPARPFRLPDPSLAARQKFYEGKYLNGEPVRKTPPPPIRVNRCPSVVSILLLCALRLSAQPALLVIIHMSSKPLN